MNEEKALARVKRQNEYIAQYTRENYDRGNILFPVGTKERVKLTGESLNAFVNRLVLAELERMGL